MEAQEKAKVGSSRYRDEYHGPSRKRAAADRLERIASKERKEQERHKAHLRAKELERYKKEHPDEKVGGVGLEGLEGKDEDEFVNEDAVALVAPGSKVSACEGAVGDEGLNLILIFAFVAAFGGGRRDTGRGGREGEVDRTFVDAYARGLDA